jgi:hypothetical protein
VSPLWPVVQFWSHCIVLAFLSVFTEECYRRITLSDDCTKLFRRGVSAYFNLLRNLGKPVLHLAIVAFYVVKRYLIYFIPVPCPVLGLLGFGGLV